MTRAVTLTVEDVLTIRRRLARTPIAEGKAFGGVEPLDIGKLQSAVGRQETGFGGRSKYNTPQEIGATLFYGINMNHSFENGNKRTAMVSLMVFLDRNKTAFVNTTEDELYDMATQVADHAFPLREHGAERSPDTEVESIAAWLNGRTRTLTLGDRVMKFGELRRTLEELGAAFDDPHQNFIKIRLGTHSVVTGYPKANFDVGVPEIKKIRRTLHLDEASGFDSSAVYDFEARVPEFANRYRQLLTRLAEM